MARQSDWQSDGTIQNWPCHAWLIRDVGMPFADLSVIAFTDDQDNPAPKPIKDICEALSVAEYPTVKAAKTALKAAGFIPD